MAKLRAKQFDPSKSGHSKMGFDGEEDGWVLVKKQRVIIVLPSLPLPEHFTVEKPENSLSQSELRDFVADTPETSPVQTMVPEHFSLQKPATSHSQAEIRDSIADRHEPTPVVPSLPLPEHFILQKPATSHSKDVLRDGIVDTNETATIQSVVPSLPVTEHYALQKPAASLSQAELREFIADTQETTLLHTAVPSLPVTEHCSLQKPATSQSQAELRDFVSDTHEATHIHTMEPESCPDFTAVDKPEMVRSRNLTTRKAPAPRRSPQDHRMYPDRRLGIRRNHTGRRKPIRFPRVMCSSVVMDNEKLRVVNLEKKVEKAGGFKEWVRSIGLGREFERMLRGQRMSKFQVANLTMEKLKQMGALAVGPRRKLIHAIHCVYHPHCLRSSF